jgi:hypothetical protein
MIYKEGPLCSRGSAFGLESAELLPACLIDLLLESFGALSVSVWALLWHLLSQAILSLFSLCSFLQFPTVSEGVCLAACWWGWAGWGWSLGQEVLGTWAHPTSSLRHLWAVSAVRETVYKIVIFWGTGSTHSVTAGGYFPFSSPFSSSLSSVLFSSLSFICSRLSASLSYF